MLRYDAEMMKLIGIRQLFLPRKTDDITGCKRAEEAFTLVELISAFAIIAILAAIAIPAYRGYILKAQISRAIVEIRMLDQEIAVYQDDKGYLPATLADINRANFTDPWGNLYVYLNIADGGIKGKGKLRRDRFVNPLNSDYDLYSVGKDGDSKTNLNAPESQDDIVRALDGSFIGLAADF